MTAEEQIDVSIKSALRFLHRCFSSRITGGKIVAWIVEKYPHTLHFWIFNGKKETVALGAVESSNVIHDLEKMFPCVGVE